MYSYSNTNILCLDDENEICDFNTDLDEYNKFNIDSSKSYHGEIPRCKLESIGYGIITFDHGRKMFKCGGLNIAQSQINEHQQSLFGNKKYVTYSYYKNAEIIDLNHDTLTGEYINDISSMIIPRAYFGMLYVNELQRVIAGPGGQRYAISCNIIEIYDIIKNKWSVVNAKTNYDYVSVVSLTENNKNNHSSFLWTDIDNPFIVNLCNGNDYVEYLDLREQNKWWINDKLNNYLREWNKRNKGQLLI